MRLIDADAFERDFTEHILPILIQRYGEEEAIRGLHFSYSDCISNISGQPTIEERKTGRWIHERVNSEHSITGNFLLSSCECSECGTFCEQESNFCPYCGADMRGDKKWTR